MPMEADLSLGLCLCPGAAAHARSWGLGTQARVLTVLESRDLTQRCRQNHNPAKGSGEGACLPLALLAVPGIPWLEATSLQLLPPSLPYPLRVGPLLSVTLTRTLAIRFRVHLNNPRESYLFPPALLTCNQ